MWVFTHPDLLTSNAVLRVTGTGVTVGPTSFTPNAFPGANPPLNLLSALVHVDAVAAPGMRSLVVQHETGLAYANGFLELAPRFPDANFDGLDDHFQRRYFPRWTAPEAAPGVDADHDGFTNADEYAAGSNPVDPKSVLTVESVRVDMSRQDHLAERRGPTLPGSEPSAHR